MSNITELLLWVTCSDCGKKRRCLLSCFVCRYCLGLNGHIGEVTQQQQEQALAKATETTR
jgi:hypothetical protein